MKSIPGMLLSLALSGLAAGQAQSPPLPVEIASAAAEHVQVVKTIDAAREAAAAGLKERYLAALAAAEMAAAKLGKVEEAAALLKVRSTIQAGSELRTPPRGTPPGQRRRYAAYFESLDRMEREFAPRYEKADSDYLKDLTAIEARLPAESPVREQIAELRLKRVNTLGGGSRKLAARYFDDTEWLWMGDPGKVWKFLPGGKIITDTGVTGHFRWRITETDSFMITAGGSDMWQFSVNFDTMLVQGRHVTNPEDTKELVFKRKVSGR